jgi:hypothetical protein
MQVNRCVEEFEKPGDELIRRVPDKPSKEYG